MINEIYKLALANRVRIDLDFLLGSSVKVTVTKLDVDAYITKHLAISKILTSMELHDEVVLKIVNELIEELNKTEVYI